MKDLTYTEIIDAVLDEQNKGVQVKIAVFKRAEDCFRVSQLLVCERGDHYNYLPNPCGGKLTIVHNPSIIERFVLKGDKIPPLSFVDDIDLEAVLDIRPGSMARYSQ